MPSPSPQDILDEYLHLTEHPHYPSPVDVNAEEVTCGHCRGGVYDAHHNPAHVMLAVVDLLIARRMNPLRPSS
jgi:hypothetical protein